MKDIMNQLIDMEQEMIALKEENRKLKEESKKFEDRAAYFAYWVEDLQLENNIDVETREAEVQAFVELKRQYGKYLPSEALGRLEYKIRDLYRTLEIAREEHRLTPANSYRLR